MQRDNDAQIFELRRQVDEKHEELKLFELRANRLTETNAAQAEELIR